MRRLFLMLIPAMLIAAARPALAQVPDTTCTLGDSARLIAISSGDLRLCVSSQDFDGATEQRPREWVTRSPHSSLETRRPNDLRRMEVIGLRVTWTINGRAQRVDSLADRWRIALLNALDSAWEADHLRATLAGLKAEIAGIPAKRDSLQAEVTSLTARSAALHGQITSLEGRDRQLRNDITAADRRSGSLESQINAQRQLESSLMRSTDPDAQSRVAAVEATIRQLEEESRQQDETTRSLQRQFDALDTESKIGAINLNLRTLNADPRIEKLKARIAGLDSNHVADLEQRIVLLHVDTRLAELEVGLRNAVARLRALLD